VYLPTLQAPTRVVVMVRRVATANTEEADGSMVDTETAVGDTYPPNTVATEVDMAATEADMVLIKLD